MLIVSFVLLFRGYRPARFFCLAWVFNSLGASLTIIRNFGFLPNCFLTIWGVENGGTFCFVLFSLVLADMINRIKNELQVLNSGLEKTVEERTRDFRESEEKYRSLVDCGVMGYYEVDLHGNFTYSNRSFRDFLGYDEVELAGMNFKQVVHEQGNPRLLSYYKDIYLGRNEVSRMSISAVRKNGQVRYGENYIDAMKNAAGEVVGFRCVGIDVTD